MKINNHLKSLNIYQIIIFAFFIRLIAWFFYGSPDFPDTNNYLNAGEELFSSGSIEAHHVMPLYPIITYIFGDSNYLILFNILVSSISVILVKNITSLIFSNISISNLSAIFWAIFPHSIFYSISLLTETLYASILLLVFYLMYIRKIYLAMFFAVLSILLRPSLDLFFPFFFLFFPLIIFKWPLTKSLFLLMKYLCIYIVIMGPWWGHQYIKYGEFIRLNLADGIVWYSGNNPLNDSGGGVTDPIKGNDFDHTYFEEKYLNSLPKKNYLNYKEYNKALREESFDYILSNPVKFIEMSLVKFVRFWRLWPYTSYYSSYIYIFISLFSFLPLLILSLATLWRCNSKQFQLIIPILSLVTYLTLVHMILIGSIRYRFPLEPFMAILAGFSAYEFLVKYIHDEKK
jgi:hypothetical protein